MNAPEETPNAQSPTPNAAPPNVEPDPRVLFAAERTLLAWIRTGVGLMGFGFVVARFGLYLRQLLASQAGVMSEPNGFALWIGMGLVLLGAIVNVIAMQQYRDNLGRINRGESLFPAEASPGALLATILGGVGLAIAVYLLLVAL